MASSKWGTEEDRKRVALALGWHTTDNNRYFTKLQDGNYVNFFIIQEDKWGKKWFLSTGIPNNAGKKDYFNDEEFLNLNDTYIDIYNNIIDLIGNPKETAKLVKEVQSKALVPVSTQRVHFMEELETNAIIQAQQTGAIIQKMFYTIKYKAHYKDCPEKGKKKPNCNCPENVANGLTYWGAEQCRRDWNSNPKNKDNPIVLDELVEDILSAKHIPNHVCMKLKAYFKKTPENAVWGRWAEPEYSFNGFNARHMIKIVESKASRNAVIKLMDPKMILLAQENYLALLKDMKKRGIISTAEAIAYKEMPALPEKSSAKEEYPPVDPSKFKKKKQVILSGSSSPPREECVDPKDFSGVVAEDLQVNLPPDNVIKIGYVDLPQTETELEVESTVDPDYQKIRTGAITGFLLFSKDAKEKFGTEARKKGIRAMDHIVETFYEEWKDLKGVVEFEEFLTNIIERFKGYTKVK